MTIPEATCASCIRPLSWPLLGLLCALFVCPAGCDQAESDGGFAEPAIDSLKVGYAPWPGFDIVVYAEEEGLFARHGVTVELVRLEHQSDVTRALMRGRLDAAFTSVYDVALAPADERPHLVLCTNVSFGSDGIVAEPGIEDVAGLRGKRVACKRQAVNELILLEALDKHGLHASDVEIVDLTNNLGAQALADGSVDAAVLWEPQLSSMAAVTGGKVVHTTAEVESLVVDGLFAHQRTVTERRAALQAFTDAWMELQRHRADHADQVYSVVAETLDQDAAVFARDYDGLKPGDQAFNRDYMERNCLQANLNKLAKLLRGEVQLHTVHCTPDFVLADR